MPSPLRITGVVRLANRVRQELSEPLSPPQRERLKDRVAAELRQIESILTQHRAKEAELPQPSQRALQFLRQINWEQISVTTEDAPPPSASVGMRLSFPWMAAFMESAFGRLSQPLSGDDLESLRQSIEKMSRQVETTTRRHEDRAVLSESARVGRAWLAFVAEPENLRAYADAVRRAASIFTPLAAEARCALPLHVHFRPMSGMYKFRSSPRGVTVSLPTPMIAFDETQFAALGRLMFSRDRKQRKVVVSAMLGEGYQTLRADLESRGGLTEQPRGAFHDLGQAFDRVNEQFFNGKMPRPRLIWSRSFTGRKFGHYDYLRDAVMVTSSLDRPDVPPFVVEYLMYHELLHKKHGTRWKNGRGYAHTPAFQAEERRFPRYHEADAIINRIARGETVDSAAGQTAAHAADAF